MSKFPRITGKQVIEALRRAKFDLVRTRGSHHFMRHPDGRATVVPVHRGETIGPGLLSRFSVTAK
ncbi:MAG TPA: type II toxin-antitoxin system HicA family toxin [Anaerolineae bacterium]